MAELSIMNRTSAMRVLWLVLPGVFLVATGALAQGARLVVTTTTGLNVRACPDPERCAVLETLAPGESLVVTTGREGWLRVESDSGGPSGWVSGGYVRIVRVPTADHEIVVSTTGQLNLRTCPDIVRCPPLVLLEVREALRVLGTQGDWLEVVRADSGLQGWVHGAYVRLDSYRVPGAPVVSTLDLSFWKPAVPFVAPTLLLLLLLARFVYRGPANPGEVKRMVASQLAAMAAILGLGSFLLLNQFGPWIQRVLANRIDLEPLAWTWEMNVVVPKGLTFTSLALGVLLLVGVSITSLPRAGSIRRCVVQGTLLGFVAVPIVALSIGVIYLVGRLLLLIWKLVAWIVTGILSVVVWIAELVAPVIRWLATPFVWLWEAFVRDLLLFLATPFVWVWDEFVWPLLEFIGRLLIPPVLWLWRVVLLPMGSFLKAYLFKPLFLMMVGLVVGCAVAAPVLGVGAVAWESVKRACRCAEGASEAFGVGVAAGLALFELATFGAFETWWGVGARPPLTLVLLAVLSLVALARLSARRIVAEIGAETPRLAPTAMRFLETSALHIVVPVVMIPIGFALVLLGEADS